MREELFEAFPNLKALEESALAIIRDSTRSVRVPSGTVIFREGNVCQDYIFVIQGAIRVQMISERGREIVLYRVEKGQTCVLTTTSLMAGTDYAAEGIAESDVNAVAIPSSSFHELMTHSASFRKFVFSAFSIRISDLLMLIEEVAFGRIDVRLAQLLLDRCGQDETVSATHQQLASELGTAREVVSRQLKEFERRAWVLLHRGHIEIRSKNDLATLAGRVKM
jgi:CRP/FNR family transcriptional regulator